MRPSFWTSLLCLACVGAACADLEPIPGSVCGNLIIDAGEECDGDDPRGTCRPPTAPDACRFDCTDAVACPEGLVCGTGSVCRAPDVCGNGVVEAGEDCDGSADCREPNQPFACRRECTANADCGVGFKCLSVGICDSADVCGNGVVEAGEDCDGAWPEGDHTCRAHDDVAPCRFDCLTGTCPADYHCADPASGGDGLCRKPSGSFKLITQVGGTSDGLFAGHFDDDGRVDILRVGTEGAQIHYFDATGVVDDVARVRLGSGAPVVGDIDGDGDDDLAFRTPSIFVSNGWEMVVALTSDRRLDIVTQITENLPGTPVAMDVLPPQNQGDLLFMNSGVATGWSLAPDTGQLSADNVGFGVTNTIFSSLTTPSPLGMTHGQFRPSNDAPCEHYAAIWPDDASIITFSPCQTPSQAHQAAWNVDLDGAIVTLPQGAKPLSTVAAGHAGLDGVLNRGGAIYAGAVDSDSFDDLLIPTESTNGPTCFASMSNPPCIAWDPVTCTCLGCIDNGNCTASEDDCVCADCAGTPECVFTCNLDGICNPYSEPCSCSDCAAHSECTGLDSVQVAYSAGDGTFHSVTPSSAPGNNSTTPLPVKLIPNFSCPDQGGPLGAPWLAVDDFNQDGRVDIVNQIGVFVSAKDASNYTFSMCPNDRWVEAVTADFDGNGSQDVVATPGGSTLILLRGDGKGGFSKSVTDAGGYVHNLVTADFDGDTIFDVAYIRTTSKQIMAGELVDIVVAYGQPLQGLAAPDVVGRSRDVQHMVAGPMSPDDQIGDIFVQTNGAERNAGFLRGSVSRQIVSSWVFRSSPPTANAVHDNVTSARALAIGNFAASNANARFSLAALTDRFGNRQRINVVSVTTDKTFAQTDNAPFACLVDGEICPGRQLVAIDLVGDGNGVDNVVALSDNAMLIFPKGAAPDMPMMVPTQIELYRSGRSALHNEVLSQANVEDIDQDGFDDLSLLDNAGKVHIMWGDGSGTLDPAKATVIEHEEPAQAFALIDNVGDTKKEIVLASASGIVVYSIDAAHAATQHAVLNGIQTADQVIAGDLDGDGIDDLVLGNALGFRVYRAEEASP